MVQNEAIDDTYADYEDKRYFKRLSMSSPVYGDDQINRTIQLLVRHYGLMYS